MIIIDELPIKVFTAYEDQPLRVLEFQPNVTVQEAISQVAIVFDLSERGPKNKILRLKFGRTELRPDWFLYDCCLPPGATLRAVYVDEKQPAFLVRILVYNEVIAIPDAISFTETTIGTLRSLVSAESGLPVSMFRLVRGDNTILYDVHPLQYYDLQKGETLMLETWKGWDEILIAARYGFTESLVQLIEEDSTTLGNYRGKVALFLAAHFGHIELASELLKFGYASNEPIGEHPYRQWCTTGQPHPDLFKAPVHVASDRGQLGILRTMIAADPSVLFAKFKGYRPLYFCLRKGHKKCIALMITKMWSKIPYADGVITMNTIHNLKRLAARARLNVYFKGTAKSSLRRRPNQWAPLVNEGISIDMPKSSSFDLTVPSMVSNDPKYASLPPIITSYLTGPPNRKDVRRRSSIFSMTSLPLYQPDSIISIAEVAAANSSTEVHHKQSELSATQSLPAKPWRTQKQQSKYMLAIMEEEEAHHSKGVAMAMADRDFLVPDKTAVKKSVMSISVGKPPKVMRKVAEEAGAMHNVETSTDERLRMEQNQSLRAKNDAEENAETSEADGEVAGSQHLFSITNSKKKRPLVHKLSTTMIQNVIPEQEQDVVSSEGTMDSRTTSSEEPVHVEEIDNKNKPYSSRLERLSRTRSLVSDVSRANLFRLLRVDSDNRVQEIEAAEGEDGDSPTKPDSEPEKADNRLAVLNEDSFDERTNSPKKQQKPNPASDNTPPTAKLLAAKAVPMAAKHDHKISSQANVTAARTASDPCPRSSNLPPITNAQPGLDKPQQSSSSLQSQPFPSIAAAGSSMAPSSRSLNTAGQNRPALQKSLVAKERILAELIAEKSKTLSCPIALPQDNNNDVPKPWVNPRKLNTADDPNTTIKNFQDRYRPGKDARTAAIEQLYRANQFSSLNFLKRVQLAINMSERNVKKALEKEQES